MQIATFLSAEVCVALITLLLRMRWLYSTFTCKILQILCSFCLNRRQDLTCKNSQGKIGTLII